MSLQFSEMFHLFTDKSKMILPLTREYSPLFKKMYKWRWLLLLLWIDDRLIGSCHFLAPHWPASQWQLWGMSRHVSPCQWHSKATAMETSGRPRGERAVAMWSDRRRFFFLFLKSFFRLKSRHNNENVHFRLILFFHANSADDWRLLLYIWWTKKEKDIPVLRA